ncbi:MAG: AgmX/PglI C-terminal domain-containing protein [Bdellovibrionales bacterium]
MKDPIVLRVYRGERLIAVKQFLSPQIVIGRQSDAGLSLDDELVSPLHAVIEQREDGFYVSDLGSEGGLSIEGTKILEALVEEGESIEIGPYSVRFYVGVPKPAVPENYKKDHEKPEVPKREIQETRVEEIELSDDELPVLPIMPDSTNPGFDVADDEGTNPSIFVDYDERTSPNIKFDASSDEEVEKASIKIQNRDVDDAIDAQKSEPVSGGYIAPSSNYDNVDEIIYPYSRGSVLEVVVCWKERILKTYHFSNKHQIFMSNSEKADIQVPFSGGALNHKLVSFSDECIVHVAKSMNGELYYDNKRESLEDVASKSALIKTGVAGQELKLDQGQMVKLDLLGDQVSAYIRFVEDTPAAGKTPVFDFSTSELVGIFMSFASVAVIALYMLFYVPSTLEDTDDLLEDRLKKAVITFSPPPRMKIPKVQAPIPKVKPRVTKVTEKAAVKKVKAQLKAGSKTARVKSKEKGKPKAAAPSRVKTKNKVGSSRPGGSVKTGKQAANMETKQKDLTKTGILSVLSGGGKNTALDKASSGVGTTIGVADSKTGYQGQLSDQAGDGIGTKLRAGKGGQGTSLAGVGDLKTSGRGGGQDGYGTSGLGGKGSTTIVGVDGVGAEFSSSIDKEAIRRLIRKNRNALKGCYDRALTRNKNVSGKVVLNWKITNGGKMKSPRVKSSTLNNAQVEQCIINRLMVLTFPDPGPNEIAEVSFPFVFNRSN